MYAVAGETGLKKKDLMTAGSRERLRVLPRNDVQRMIAASIERELGVTETELAAFRERIAGIVRESEMAPYIMSIPGVGPALAAAFIAYVGDGDRFTKSAVAAHLPARARRMVGLMWILAKRRQLYADVSAGELARKFRYYKLAGWESWFSNFTFSRLWHDL
ncbi:MAG: transposase [Treponema sp.]|nr:transposase [Treponema sp.]